KAAHKYLALTNDYIVDPTRFAALEGIPQPLRVLELPVASRPGICSEDGDAAFEGGDVDTRAHWHSHEQAVTFVRFYGYARNPASCDTQVDHVFAVDAQGLILCVSRTGRNMWWDLPMEWKARRISRSLFTFDFSCPLVGKTSNAARP